MRGSPGVYVVISKIERNDHQRTKNRVLKRVRVNIVGEHFVVIWTIYDNNMMIDYMIGYYDRICRDYTWE